MTSTFEKIRDKKKNDTVYVHYLITSRLVLSSVMFVPNYNAKYHEIFCQTSHFETNF